MADRLGSDAPPDWPKAAAQTPNDIRAVIRRGQRAHGGRRGGADDRRSGDARAGAGRRPRARPGRRRPPIRPRAEEHAGRARDAGGRQRARRSPPGRTRENRTSRISSAASSTSSLRVRTPAAAAPARSSPASGTSRSLTSTSLLRPRASPADSTCTSPCAAPIARSPSTTPPGRTCRSSAPSPPTHRFSSSRQRSCVVAPIAERRLPPHRCATGVRIVGRVRRVRRLGPRRRAVPRRDALLVGAPSARRLRDARVQGRRHADSARRLLRRRRLLPGARRLARRAATTRARPLRHTRRFASRRTPGGRCATAFVAGWSTSTRATPRRHETGSPRCSTRSRRPLDGWESKPGSLLRGRFSSTTAPSASVPIASVHGIDGLIRWLARETAASAEDFLMQRASAPLPQRIQISRTMMRMRASVPAPMYMSPPFSVGYRWLYPGAAPGNG